MSYITTDGRQMKTNENFKATAAIASSNEVKEKKENTRKRKNFNICIQPATARIETNLQTKYLSLANIHNDNNNNNNNNSNNVNSKVKCKQYNVIRHKWQKPWWSHHQQQSSKQFIFRRANKMQNFLQKLIVIRTVILLFIACFLPSIQAGCRYEPSRSCEAICRPVWSSMDNDNYQLLHNNATTTTSTTTDGTANSVQILKNFNANDYNCTIRALVLMPDDERYVASLKRVVPILQVAEQRIHARGLLPPFIHFDWMPQDDKCDAAFAAVKAMDGIVKNCSHVFFGPVCDYSLAGVARIVKYFNSHGTPLISVGGSTYDFEKPKTKCSDEFYMLVRTGMLSFESISELTITVMKSYKWSRSILFYDANGQYSVAGQHTCYLMMTSLGKQMRSENMTFAQYRTSGNVTNRTAEIAREIGNKNTEKLFHWHCLDLAIETSQTARACRIKAYEYFRIRKDNSCCTECETILKRESNENKSAGKVALNPNKQSHVHNHSLKALIRCSVVNILRQPKGLIFEIKKKKNKRNVNLIFKNEKKIKK